jgi:hypothetical protein
LGDGACTHTYTSALEQHNIIKTNTNTHSEYSAGNWLLKGEVVEPLDKTPLHVALETGNLESAKMLIDAGKCGTACTEVDAV